MQPNILKDPAAKAGGQRERLARRGRAGRSTRDLEPVAGFARGEGSIVANRPGGRLNGSAGNRQHADPITPPCRPHFCDVGTHLSPGG